MSICVIKVRRPDAKCCFITAALIILVLSVFLATFYWAPWNKYDLSDNDDDDSPPEDLSCEELTRTRSMDEYWACLVYGPTKFLLPLEEMDDKIPQGIQLYSIQKKIKSSNKNQNMKQINGSGGRRRRVKRHETAVHGPYQRLNATHYNLEILPISELSQSVRNHANDPFYRDSLVMYKRVASPLQQAPIWAYKGHFGKKEWHQLGIQQFIVPISGGGDRGIGDLNLYRAVFSDLWDEDKFIDDANFRKAFFTDLKNENDHDEQLRTLLKYLYPAQFVPGFIAPLMFVQDDNNQVQIVPEKRVLVDHRIDDGTELNPPHTGHYSFMRFFLQPRPSSKEILENVHILPPQLKRHNVPDIPASPINFQRVVDLLEKKDDKYKEVHKLTPEEDQIVEMFKNITADMGFKFDPPDPSLPGPKPTLHSELKRWIETNLIAVRDEQKALQAKYSLPIFPKKFPICLDREQSPLNIIKKQALDSSLPPYELVNGEYFYRYVMSVPPDGTSVLSVVVQEATRAQNKAIQLKGGATRGVPLYFEVLNIKYGNEVGKGSEHRIDGEAFDMELQFMFTYQGPNEEQPYWFTLSRQLNDLFPFREKLVQMISVFVKVDKNMKIDSPEALLFEPFAQTVYKFRAQLEQNPTKDHYRSFRNRDYTIRFKDFFPKNSTYYTYRGGLTIPPCFSYIIWSVYEKPIYISPKQYTEFTLFQTQTEDSGSLAGSLRTPDDIVTAYESEPNILPSEKRRRKELRINRAVLKSLPINDANEATYDYYSDFDSASLPNPSILLALHCFLVIFEIFTNYNHL